MIAPELAALLEPFAKWGAVALTVLLLVWLIRFWVRQAAKDEERLETVLDAERREDEARDAIKKKAQAIRDRLAARERRRGL